MSSNKIKKGWKRTYEKNDRDAWKKQKRQIMQEHNASDESSNTKDAHHPQPIKTSKNLH